MTTATRHLDTSQDVLRQIGREARALAGALGLPIRPDAVELPLVDLSRYSLSVRPQANFADERPDHGRGWGS